MVARLPGKSSTSFKAVFAGPKKEVIMLSQSNSTGFSRFSHFCLTSVLTLALIILISTSAVYSAQVKLGWDPNPEEEELSGFGYRLYSGTSSNTYDDIIEVGNVAEYTVTGLDSGVTYFFALKAHATGVLDSPFSDELPYTVPETTPTADTTPPTIVSINSTGTPNKLTVLFSEPVEKISATNASNYFVDNGITIYEASLASDLKTVSLITSQHEKEILYTLAINNVEDRADIPNIIDPDLQASYNFINFVSCIPNPKFEKTILSEGMVYYTDRTYTLYNVPLQYDGLEMIKTPNNDKNLTDASDYLTFGLQNDASVYVAYDQRATNLPDWMNGFTNTGDIINTSQSNQGWLNVYSKQFSAGECVNIGGNKGSGSSTESLNNYFVFQGINCTLDTKFEQTTLNKGMVYYTDRTYTLSNVPLQYNGLEMIKTPNNDKGLTEASDYMTFAIQNDATVYVAFDDRTTSLPLWMREFTYTGDIITTESSKRKFKVHSKDYFAGECVNLGANNAPGFSGVANNYFVFYASNVLPTPNSLQAEPVSSFQIDLSWKAPTDDLRVAGYKVYRDGEEIASIQATTYNDTGLFAATTYIYTVSVFDAEDSESGKSTKASATTLDAVNTPPTLRSIGDMSVREGTLLNFTASATDPDDKELTFTESNLPPGAIFNESTQTFSWTPTFNQAGDYTMTCNVSDGRDSASETFTITVENVNRAPKLDPIKDVSVDEGDTITLNPTATDLDDDTFTFSYSGWMDSDSYITGFGDAGTYSVTVTVSDGSLTDSQNVTIKVGNINRAPELNPIADITINESETITLKPKATDPDKDTLVFSYSGWMDSDSYITGFDDAGTYSVTVTVSDGSLTDSQNVTIKVIDIENDPPTVTSVTSVDDPTVVTLVFSEPVEKTSATNASNYFIDNGITIFDASLASDLITVTLKTSNHTKDTTYTLSIINVTDRAIIPNVIDANIHVNYNFVSLDNCTLADKFQKATVQNGTTYYTDRKYTLADVPLHYVGLEMIKTPNDDKNLADVRDYMTFEMQNDSTVYVAYDQRVTSLPKWMSEFTDTGDIITTGSSKRKFKIYSKDYVAGECVNLGANMAPGFSGGTNNYFVFYGTETIPCDLDPKFEQTTLREGMEYYTDRPYTLSNVPSHYVGLDMIKTLNDDKENTCGSDYITFALLKDTTVYVAYDKRAEILPDWMQGFQDTGDKINTSQVKQGWMKVYSKQFSRGECVNFGCNKGPGFSGATVNNYIVIID